MLFALLIALCTLPHAFACVAPPAALAAQVAETGEYCHVYTLELGDAGCLTCDPNYAVDFSTGGNMTYDRVAYYFQLDDDWVYVSMQAFESNDSWVGIPDQAHTYQTFVQDMNVYGFMDQRNVHTGNVEIFPLSYLPSNTLGVPNAEGGAYDWGDEPAPSSGSHGCFQVHNYDVDGDGPRNDGVVLFALNAITPPLGPFDVGIGNNPAGPVDWTNAGNAASFSVKKLVVLVREQVGDCANSTNGPGGSPCRHGGQCVDDVPEDGNFVCNCTGTGTHGSNCENVNVCNFVELSEVVDLLCPLSGVEVECTATCPEKHFGHPVPRCEADGGNFTVSEECTPCHPSCASCVDDGTCSTCTGNSTLERGPDLGLCVCPLGFADPGAGCVAVNCVGGPPYLAGGAGVNASACANVTAGSTCEVVCVAGTTALPGTAGVTACEASVGTSEFTPVSLSCSDRPLVTVAPTDGRLTNGDILFSITFSEPVTTVPNVSVSVSPSGVAPVVVLNATDTGAISTVTAHVTGLSIGVVTLDVVGGSAFDAAGNPCHPSVVSGRITYDGERPAPVFIPRQGARVNSPEVSFTIDFGEPVELTYQEGADVPAFKEFDHFCGNRLCFAGGCPGSTFISGVLSEYAEHCAEYVASRPECGDYFSLGVDGWCDCVPPDEQCESVPYTDYHTFAVRVADPVVRNYYVMDNTHCRGSSVVRWADGTSADYGSEGVKNLETCMQICNEHAECAGFVQQKFRRTLQYCSYWKSTMVPDVTGLHYCFRRKILFDSIRNFTMEWTSSSTLVISGILTEDKEYTLSIESDTYRDIAGNGNTASSVAVEYDGLCDPLVVSNALYNGSCGTSSLGAVCVVSCPGAQVYPHAAHTCAKINTTSVQWSPSCVRGDCLVGCRECDMGFHAAPDRRSCVPCAPGTWTDVVGIFDASQCTPCTIGTYSNVSNATSVDTCLPCAAGETSPAGADTCSPCLMGQYQSGDTCLECPNDNQYAPLGSVFCRECEAGSAPAPDRGSCVPCPLGWFAPASSVTCMTCGNARVPNDDRSGCIDCDNFEVSNSSGTSCRLCGNGSFPAPDLSNCVQCDANGVAMFNSTECSVCPRGFRPNAVQNVCDRCPDTMWASASSVNCSFCPAGSVPTAEQDGCEACPPDRVAPAASAVCVPCADPTGSLPAVTADVCECRKDFFTSTAGSAACEPCPTGGACAGASALPRNVAGFFCQPGDAYEFYACREAFLCLEECACLEFHDASSPGCSACIKGAYKGPGDRSCRKCPSVNLALLLIAGIGIAFGACVFLIMIARKSRAYFPSLVVGLNFVQIISVMGYLSIEWPNLLSSFFEFTAIFSLDIQLVHPECAFDNTDGVFVTMWALKMAVPLFVAFLFFFFYCVAAVYCYWKYELKAHLLKETSPLESLLEIDIDKLKTKGSMKSVKAPWKEHLRDFKYVLINAFLTMLAVVYLLAALTSFEVFVCLSFEVANGDVVRVLAADPAIQCSLSDPVYPTIAALGALGVCIYVIGLPALFYGLLQRNKHRLGQNPVIAKFGLLYRRYSLSKYWWEIAIMMRKLAMVVARTFFADYAIIQVVVCLAVAIMSFFATKKYKPFVSKHVNRLEELCLFCAIVILSTGVVFGSVATRSGDWKLVGTALGIVCITIWCLCILFVAFNFSMDVWALRRRRKYGIDDDTASDDLVVFDDFFAQNLKIVAYKRAVALGTDKNPRQQQIRLAIAAPVGTRMHFLTRLSEYSHYDLRHFGGGKDSYLSDVLREPVDETFTLNMGDGDGGNEDLPSFTNSPHTKSQIALHTRDQQLHLIDGLFPKPGRYAVEIAIQEEDPKADLKHILHVIVDSNDRGNVFESPAEAVEIVATKRPLTVYSPVHSMLVANQAVVFRFYVENATEVFVVRNLREFGGDNDAMLQSLKETAQMSHEEEETLRILMSETREKTTRALNALHMPMNPVGQGVFVSDTVQVLHGDTFEVKARFQGADDTEVLLASYSAGKRVDCELCEVFPARVCCTDCALYLCRECNKAKHKKKLDHNVVDIKNSS